MEGQVGGLIPRKKEPEVNRRDLTQEEIVRGIEVLRFSTSPSSFGLWAYRFGLEMGYVGSHERIVKLVVQAIRRRFRRRTPQTLYPSPAEKGKRLCYGEIKFLEWLFGKKSYLRTGKNDEKRLEPTIAFAMKMLGRPRETIRDWVYRADRRLGGFDIGSPDNVDVDY